MIPTEPYSWDSADNSRRLLVDFLEGLFSIILLECASLWFILGFGSADRQIWKTGAYILDIGDSTFAGDGLRAL